MKTAKELCEQITQDKLNEIEKDLQHIIYLIRVEGGSRLFYKGPYHFNRYFDLILANKDKFLKLGYKIKIREQSWIERFFGGDLILEISACCGVQNENN